MKPPPRIRNKPNRSLEPQVAPRDSRKPNVNWRPAEQKKLLKALKALGRTFDGHGDVDCARLRKQVPTRSVSEIQSFVESLQNRVISSASLQLKKKRSGDEKVKKPIEVWTHMASALVGSLEESVSSAFFQVMAVSSTEPRSLRNCDPPKVYRPPMSADGPVGRTIPSRPMPCSHVKGKRPGTSRARPLFVLKTPAPTLGPAHRLPAISKVVRVVSGRLPPPQPQPLATAGTSPAATCSSPTAVTSCPPRTAELHIAPPATVNAVAQTMTPVTTCSNSTVEAKTQGPGSSVNQTTRQPLEQQPTTTTTTTSNIKSTSSSLLTPLSSSATSPSLLPSTAPSSAASSVPASSSCSSSHPMPPLSTPAAAGLGCTSKVASKDSPRTFGVKHIVDFEKLYRYLSAINKPEEECHLTPMESAIILDLLMSLPQEMSLLDCPKLDKHLTQVYQCLSSPADSKMAREMFKDLKDRPTAQRGEPSSGDGATPDCQQNTAKTVDGEEPDVAESRSPRSKNASGQPGKAGVMGHCPPLNPFLVPLKLLVRK